MSIGSPRTSRRHLLTAVPGLVVAIFSVGKALSQARRPIVVLLTTGSIASAYKAAVVAGIAEAGLAEGRDFDLIERTGEGDADRTPGLIAETLALNPTVIVSSTTGLTVALRKETASIPIVNVTIAQPVELGLAASLARPGGNVTGMLAISASGGKLVELLLEIVPGLTRLGMLLNPKNTGNTQGLLRFKEELKAVSVQLIPVEAERPTEIEAAFQALASQGTQGLFLVQDPLFNREINKIADLALAAGLPTVYGFRFLPDAGGLMSYGGDLKARWRRIGSGYVAKILQGEKPGEIPIEQQERLQLIINMRTAKALGLTVPRSILMRADEVIE